MNIGGWKLAFQHTSDSSRQRHQGTTRAIASRERLTSESPPPLSDLLSQFDPGKFFTSIPNYSFSLAQSAPFLTGLKFLNALIKHPDFEEFSLFLNPDFVAHWPQVLSQLISTIVENAVQAIEVVAQLWKIISDSESPLASEPFVVEIFRALSNPLPALKPSVFFAFANYCAISRHARDRLIALGLDSHLVRYLEAFTCNDHVRSGLRLARNILNFGVDDVLPLAERLIPIFRCHLLHAGEKNRRLAAHCLTLLIDNAVLFPRCVELEVPTQLCYCAEHDPVYSNELFAAVSLFVAHGYDTPFVTVDFLSVLAGILAENLEVPMPAFFTLVRKLMVIMGNRFGGFLSGLFCQAEKGCFENRSAAVGILFAWIENCDAGEIKLLATEQLFHSAIEVLQSADGAVAEAILRGVLRIHALQDEELNAIWHGWELSEVLDSEDVFHHFPHLALPQDL
jgi:hypothetical protein